MECAEDVVSDQGLEGELKYKVVGGYRRGKKKNKDVDLLITISNEERNNLEYLTLGRELHDKLEAEGLVFKKLKMSRRRFDDDDELKPNPKHPVSHREKFDLQMILLHDGKKRRVDIFVVHPDSWPWALLGYTGSMMFERELRLYGKKCCEGKEIFISQKEGWVKNKSTNANHWETVEVSSEEDIFELLELDYLKPSDRNL